MSGVASVIAQAFEGLRGHNLEADFFLRDDDIDCVEDTLQTLLNVCRRRQTPVSLAVIPGGLTREAAAFLGERVSADPGLIELHQHGWKHVSHEAQGRKCEFGPSRSFEEQLADIAEGKARLDEAFGAHWFPAFTPPWNRSTEDTFRAVERLGFEVLSTDRRRPAAFGFHQEPVTLDLYRWKGHPAMRPAGEIAAELATQIEGRQTIGILLHHKVMDAAAFDFLDFLLGEIRRYPLARFHTLRTLRAAQ